jgi:phosphoserine phosphatase
MLEIVDNPIVFNPTHELLEKALKNHWKIVLERKNISYELESKKDATVVLAQTNHY